MGTGTARARGVGPAPRRENRPRDGGLGGGRASWRLWSPRPFMGRRAGRLLVTAFLLLAGAAAAPAASFPPELRFRSLSTDRVTVHFHQGLEAMARRAAPLATEILERHEARYGVHAGPVNPVLPHVADDPNGVPSPLPYPPVHLRAVPPAGRRPFANSPHWLPLH